MALEILAQALNDISPLQITPEEQNIRLAAQRALEERHESAILALRAEIDRAASDKTDRRRFKRRRAALRSQICEEDTVGFALHWFEYDLAGVARYCEMAEVSECVIYRQVWTRVVLAGKMSARIAEITLELARGKSLRELHSSSIAAEVAYFKLL